MSIDNFLLSAPLGKKARMGASLFSYARNRERFFHFAIVATVISMVAIFFLAAPQIAHAQPAAGELAAEATGAQELGLYYGESTGLSGDSLPAIIARIIRVALGLLGIVALGIVLYGGFLWMTAGGDADKVTKAKQWLVNGAIGTAIILSAFAITSFIINSLVDGTLGFRAGENDNVPGGAASFSDYSGSRHLGTVIQDHFPMRGAKDVARNTQIIISFREPMQLDTLVADCVEDQCSSLNLNNVQIAPTTEFEAEEPAYLSDATIYVTGEGRTLTIIPTEYLGVPNEEIPYTVKLGPGVKRATGADAFGGLKPNYEWVFTLGGQVDETPPRVLRVSPAEQVGPDRLVQITFSESMSPVGLDVSTDATHFISIKTGDVEVVGRYRAVNNYRSVTFLPEQVCGQNACGQEKRCLPFNSDIDALLETAQLLAEGSPASVPGSGLTDTSGNALDGNADGEAAGPPDPANPTEADNYAWSFSTTDQLDLTSPHIASVNPVAVPVQGGVVQTQVIEIQFSEEMSLATIADSLGFETEDDAPPVGFWITMDEEEFGDQEGTKARMTPALTLVDETFYAPRIPYTVFDASQNCFYPSIGPGCEQLDGDNPSCCSYREDLQGPQAGPAQGCEDILSE